jgi:hypothetical protein
MDLDPTRNDLDDLRRTAEAAEALAANPEIFQEAAEAFLARDAGRFQAALAHGGLEHVCPVICGFFCEKHCLGICRSFCPEPAEKPLDPKEWLAFAQAIGRLVRQEEQLDRLVALIDAGDVQGWLTAVKEFGLERFCHQLCHFLCSRRCKRVCRELCPPSPLITRVGSIPVDQITPIGFGNGEGVPPFHVPPPNPSAGIGDHPFGASVWLMGVFNFPPATQYMVEVASAPGGPYAPIDGVPVPGYNQNPTPPPTNIDLPPPGRLPTPGGWYDISGIPSSDGGPIGNNEKTLMYWPSSMVADGVHYLRLQVRDGVGTTRVSSPQIVVIDNSGPFPAPRPTITLELMKKDGTIEELKCGKVGKEDGLIRVTVHAYDPNLSAVSVTARGDSGLSVPVAGVPIALWPGGPTVSLSKTYYGDVAEQGYPVPTSFVWDPFSDPRIVPCCYLVYVEVNDRAILNDSYSGGHYNAGWEAIEIGL